MKMKYFLILLVLVFGVAGCAALDQNAPAIESSFWKTLNETVSASVDKHLGSGKDSSLAIPAGSDVTSEDWTIYLTSMLGAFVGGWFLKRPKAVIKSASGLFGPEKTS